MPTRTDAPRGARLLLIPLIAAALPLGCDSNPNAPSASRKLDPSITAGAGQSPPPTAAQARRPSRND